MKRFFGALGLRARLVLVIGLLAVAAAVSLGFIVEQSARHQILSDLGDALGVFAFQMTQGLDQGREDRDLRERWGKVQELAAMTDRNQLGMLITDRHGKVLVGPEELLGQVLALESVKAAQAGATGHLRERWPDGKTYLSGYAKTADDRSNPEQTRLVVIRQALGQALLPAKKLSNKTLLATLALASLFVLIGAIMAGWITRPITRMAGLARRMREGSANQDFSVVDDYPEVLELSTALNSLVTSVRQHERELEDLNVALEAKVRSRTTELELINQSLTTEMAAKQKSESERTILIKRLQEFATRDALTSLLNRRAFMEQLDQEIEVHRRHDRGLALVLFDIDHFKKINDDFGHPAGDAVLRAVGKEVQRFLRASDSGGRLGGEEFGLLLRQVDQKQALRQAMRLRERFEGMTIQSGEKFIRLTASFGVIAVPPADSDRDELLKAADVALYQAKAKGRNRVVLDEAGVP